MAATAKPSTSPATEIERKIAYVRELPDVNSRTMLRGVAVASARLDALKAELARAEGELSEAIRQLDARCDAGWSASEIMAARVTAETFFAESLPHLREILQSAARD